MTEDNCKAECTQELKELLCVTYEVTFRVDASLRIVDVDCLGSYPPGESEKPKHRCD